MNAPALQIRDLEVTVADARAPVRIIDGVQLDVERGRTLCVVGESGCGKSMLALAIMGLLPRKTRMDAGSVRLDGLELRGMPERRLCRLRGRRMAMVFQNPGASLNPLLSVGDHLAEALRAHGVAGSAQRHARAVQALREVGIDDAQARLEQFPHQLSGGLQQRVAIAMALALQPDLLIADEPTTALDASVQAQILGLLRGLQRRTGMAMLFITHDMGVVADLADTVAVMYAGRVIEQGTAQQVLADPQHPYTLALLASTPQLQTPGQRLSTIGGSVPQPGRLPPGCRFHPRCVFAQQACSERTPVLRTVAAAGHGVACLRAPLEEAAA